MSRTLIIAAYYLTWYYRLRPDALDSELRLLLDKVGDTGKDMVGEAHPVLVVKYGLYDSICVRPRVVDLLT